MSNNDLPDCRPLGAVNAQMRALQAAGPAESPDAEITFLRSTGLPLATALRIIVGQAVIPEDDVNAGLCVTAFDLSHEKDFSVVTCSQCRKSARVNRDGYLPPIGWCGCDNNSRVA